MSQIYPQSRMIFPVITIGFCSLTRISAEFRGTTAAHFSTAFVAHLESGHYFPDEFPPPLNDEFSTLIALYHAHLEDVVFVVDEKKKQFWSPKPVLFFHASAEGRTLESVSEGLPFVRIVGCVWRPSAKYGHWTIIDDQQVATLPRKRKGKKAANTSPDTSLMLHQGRVGGGVGGPRDEGIPVVVHLDEMINTNTSEEEGKKNLRYELLPPTFEQFRDEERGFDGHLRYSSLKKPWWQPGLNWLDGVPMVEELPMEVDGVLTGGKKLNYHDMRQEPHGAPYATCTVIPSPIPRQTFTFGRKLVSRTVCCDCRN